jgi:hypothetical protein
MPDVRPLPEPTAFVPLDSLLPTTMPRHPLIYALLPLLSASPAFAHGEQIVGPLFFSLVGIGTLIGLLLAAFVPGRALTKVAAFTAAIGGGACLLLSFFLGVFPMTELLFFIGPLVLPSLFVLASAVLLRSRPPEVPNASVPRNPPPQKTRTGA